MYRLSKIAAIAASLSCLASADACPPIPADAVCWTAGSGGPIDDNKAKEQ